MARVRTDFISGTLSATLGATSSGSSSTMSAAALASLPTIATPDIATIICEAEIMWVTAHTGGATTATVLRGQEGTSAPSHASTTAWVHGPTATDFEDVPYVDARFYGLKANGDGAGGGSDDYAALVAASYVALAAGKPIWIPAGSICNTSGTIAFGTKGGLVSDGLFTIYDTRTTGSTAIVGNVTNGSATVTITSGTLTAADNIGNYIYASGTAAGTYVRNVSGATLTLSRAYTGSTASGVTFTLPTLTTLQFHGTAGSFVNQPVLQGAIIKGAASRNLRIGASFRFAAKARIRDCEFWGAIVRGHAWWDSTIDFTRFDQCGSADGTNRAAVVLTASDGDNTNCNSLRFNGCTWETSADRALHVEGHGTQPNLIRFTNCKYETITIRGDQIVVDGTSFVSFAACDFSTGDFYSGYSTPANIVTLANNIYPVVTGCQFQGIPSATRTIARDIYLSGGNAHSVLQDNDCYASTNQDGSSHKFIEYAGSNTNCQDRGNAISWYASTSPTLRTGTATSSADPTGVSAGSYGDSSNTPVLTIDAAGRVTSASTAAVSGGGGTPPAVHLFNSINYR